MAGCVAGVVTEGFHPMGYRERDRDHGGCDSENEKIDQKCSEQHLSR